MTMRIDNECALTMRIVIINQRIDNMNYDIATQRQLCARCGCGFVFFSCAVLVLGVCGWLPMVAARADGARKRGLVVC